MKKKIAYLAIAGSLAIAAIVSAATLSETFFYAGKGIKTLTIGAAPLSVPSGYQYYFSMTGANNFLQSLSTTLGTRNYPSFSTPLTSTSTPGFIAYGDTDPTINNSLGVSSLFWRDASLQRVGIGVAYDSTPGTLDATLHVIPGDACSGTPASCDTYVESGACSAHHGCSWDDGSTCSAIGNEMTCNEQIDCQWNAGINCSQYNNNEAGCDGAAGMGCSWNPTENPCSIFDGDQSSCNSHVGCTWDTASCSAFDGDEGACNSHAGCSYSDPTCSGTYDLNTCSGTYENTNGVCEGDVPAACDPDPLCLGTPTECITYGNESACEDTNTGGCGWGPSDAGHFEGNLAAYVAQLENPSNQTRLSMSTNASQAADYSVTWPPANAGGFLKNDGGGVLSFTALSTSDLDSGVLVIARGGTASSATLNNNRVMKSSGGSIIEAAAITANRALISDSNGIPTHAPTTSTEIGYVGGVTSAIQTQLNTKAPSASPTFTGTVTLPLGSITSSGWKVGNYHVEPSEVDDGNSGTADTLDLSTGSVRKSTLTGNVTYTITNPQVGGAYVIRILTGAGSFTVTWPATVKWPGGTAPTITTTASRMDLVNLVWDGTNYYGSFAQNYTP